MTSSTFFMGIFYTIQAIITSLLLGNIFKNKFKEIPLQEKTKFYIGISLTPFYIGIVMILLSFIPFKLSNFVRALSPLLILVLAQFTIKKDDRLKLYLNKSLYSDKEAPAIGVLLAFFSGIFVFSIHLAVLYVEISFLSMIEYCLLATIIFIISLFVVLGKDFYKKLGFNSKNMFLLPIGYFIVYLFLFIENNYCYLTFYLKNNGYTIWKIARYGFQISFAILFMLGFCFIAKKLKVKQILKFKTMLGIFTILILLFSNITMASELLNLESYGTFGVLIKWSIFSAITTAIIYKFLLASNDERKKREYIYIIPAFLFTCFIGSYIFKEMIVSSCVPIIGSDAVQYMSEALQFAKEGTFSSINNFLGSKDGTLLANIHNPVWPTYMANAILFAKDGALGYPNDFALRIAIQLTHYYVIFALLALCNELKIKYGKVIALTAILFFPLSSYTLSSASRDLFRMIPVLLLLPVLIGVLNGVYKVSQGIIDKKHRIGMYTLPFIVCMAIMIGHPINAIPSISIAISCFIYVILNKTLVKESFIVCIFSVLGALAGSYTIIWAFITTGNFTGGLIDIDKLLYNTDYYVNFMKHTENRLLGTTNYLERVNLIFSRDNYFLSVLGIIFAIIILVIWIFNYKKEKKIDCKAVVALVVLFNAVLLTDLFAWSGSTLSQWSVMNARYTLHFYFFWGIALAIGLSYLIEKIKLINIKAISDLYSKNNIIAIISVLILFIYTGLNLNSTYNLSTVNYKTYMIYINELVKIKSHIEEEDGKILADNFSINYYLDNAAVTLLSQNANDIRKADTIEELDIQLKKENISIVLLTTRYDVVYWDNTVLEEYVNSSKVSHVITGERFDLYELN